MTRRIAIAGAGPAGLTAAYELARHPGGDFEVAVYEADGCVGGISRTVDYKGYRIDMGGHRFFSKSRRVNEFWSGIMPDCTDSGATVRSGRAMLLRHRVSHIYYLRRFFDYPVSASMRTFRALGLRRTIRCAAGYLKSRFRKLPEDNLENFYINRFGRPLYRMFFESYTQKVWGVHPSGLDAGWGAQRVRGLSLTKVLKEALCRSGAKPGSEVETSLITTFRYPKLGPGEFWEAVAQDAADSGALICLDTEVEEIHLEKGRIAAITVRKPDGTRERKECDIFLSSMPVKDLVASLRGIEIPERIRRLAATLPYRDFMTVGVLVKKLTKKLEDNWIYIQESGVKLGRVQIFNNWSPYMAGAGNKGVWLGLEYFCNEGDEMWKMPDENFINMAVEELVSIGFAEKADITDAVRIRVRKAYPAYHGAYGRFDEIRGFLDSIPNLYCIGRNGQHRYNNMDHSMLTAMEAVECITTGNPSKAEIWNVNEEKDYHERQ